MVLGPRSRLPPEVPFWLYIEGERMLAVERNDDVTADDVQWMDAASLSVHSIRASTLRARPLEEKADAMRRVERHVVAPTAAPRTRGPQVDVGGVGRHA